MAPHFPIACPIAGPLGSIGVPLTFHLGLKIIPMGVSMVPRWGPIGGPLWPHWWPVGGPVGAPLMAPLGAQSSPTAVPNCAPLGVLLALLGLVPLGTPLVLRY